MSKADLIFKENIKRIITEGFSDENRGAAFFSRLIDNWQFRTGNFSDPMLKILCRELFHVRRVLCDRDSCTGRSVPGDFQRSQ